MLDLILPAVVDSLWPIVVIGVVIFFRHEIRELLTRLRSATSQGFDFDPARQSPNPPNGESEPELERRVIPGNQEVHPIVAVRAKELRNLLYKESIKEPEEREGRLLTALAQSNIREDFEQIYSTIYGSQLLVLKSLYESGEQHLTAFYAQHVIRTPVGATHLDEERWTAFLSAQKLTKDENGKLKLTDYGKLFYEWLTGGQKPLNKLW